MATYKHIESLSLSELEQFCKDHPDIWGKSKMLFHPEHAQVTPRRDGCNLCSYCEGEASYNCMNLTFEVRY